MIMQTPNHGEKRRGQKHRAAGMTLEESIREETLQIKKERIERQTLNLDIPRRESQAEQECWKIASQLPASDGFQRDLTPCDLECSVRILCQPSIPSAPFLRLAMDVMLHHFLLPKVQPINLAALTNSFAELRQELQSHGVSDSRLDRVTACLRRDAREIFANLASAAVGSIDDRHETNSSAPRRTQTPVTPATKASVEKRLDKEDETRLASPQYNSERPGTPSQVTAPSRPSERGIQHGTEHSSHVGSPTVTHYAAVAGQAQASAPEDQDIVTSTDDASVRSRYFPTRTGTRTDAEDLELSDDGKLCTIRKRPKERYAWCRREESIVLRGMRLRLRTSYTRRQLATEGYSRSAIAIRTRKCELKRRYPPSRWQAKPEDHTQPELEMIDAIHSDSDRISKTSASLTNSTADTANSPGSSSFSPRSLQLTSK